MPVRLPPLSQGHTRPVEWDHPKASPNHSSATKSHGPSNAPDQVAPSHPNLRRFQPALSPEPGSIPSPSPLPVKHPPFQPKRPRLFPTANRSYFVRPRHSDSQSPSFPVSFPPSSPNQPKPANDRPQSIPPSAPQPRQSSSLPRPIPHALQTKTSPRAGTTKPLLQRPAAVETPPHTGSSPQSLPEPPPKPTLQPLPELPPPYAGNTPMSPPVEPRPRPFQRALPSKADHSAKLAPPPTSPAELPFPPKANQPPQGRTENRSPDSHKSVASPVVCLKPQKAETPK